MRKSILITAILFVILGGSLLLYYFGGTALDYLIWGSDKPFMVTHSDREPKNEEEIQKLLKVTFPAGYKILGFKYVGGMDDCMFLKLSIPAESFDAFWAASPFKDGMDTTKLDSHFKKQEKLHLDWWDGETCLSRQIYDIDLGSGITSKREAAEIMICRDKENQGEIVLYLFWFEV